MNINTFPLSKFIPIYCDAEYGELSEEQAKELIAQYQDAITIETDGRQDLASELQALDSFINRCKLNIKSLEVAIYPEIIAEMREDGFKYTDCDTWDDHLLQIDRLNTQLANHVAKYNLLKSQYDKLNSKGEPVSYDWFLKTCMSISDMVKYRVTINDLSVKEFCLRYKEYVRYVEKMSNLNKK